MTFLTSFLTAALLAAPQAPDCVPIGRTDPRHVFTNADLDRIAACRAAQESPHADASPSAHAATETSKPPRSSRGARSTSTATSALAADIEGRDALESDWRARWRSVDQKAKKLRREARELRAEAAQAPRDPKKPIVGRRAPSVLIARAEALEDEARDLVSEFEEMARRRGALPGWLRAEGR